MKVEQFLYGYRDGHRLVAGSTELDDSVAWELVRTTDRPSSTPAELDAGIFFGFPLEGSLYVICRTWSARDVSRPGAVWTHALLVPALHGSPVACIPFLTSASVPNPDDFRETIETTSSGSRPHYGPLSSEGAMLLLAVASQPRDGFHATCSRAPLDVLLNAQTAWPGLLSDRPFATTAGKKLPSSSQAVRLLGPDAPHDPSTATVSLTDSAGIASERVRLAWERVDRSPSSLDRWLSEVRVGIAPSSANMKLTLEAMLLGRHQLDDSKLLERVASLRTPGQEPALMRFALGEDIGGIEAPPRWVAALFLLREASWESWSGMANPGGVARAAATAPVADLAGALSHPGTAAEVASALRILATSIDPPVFAALAAAAPEAADALVQRNPDLIFAVRGLGPAHRRLVASAAHGKQGALPWKLKLLQHVPGVLQGLVLDVIEDTHAEAELRSFAADAIRSDSWPALPLSVQKILRAIPQVPEAVMASRPTPAAISTLLSEFGSRQVGRALGRLQGRKSTDLQLLANAFVAVIGVSKPLAGSQGLTLKPSAKLVAAFADARWAADPSPLALNTIRHDLAAVEDPRRVLQLVTHRDLSEHLRADRDSDEL